MWRKLGTHCLFILKLVSLYEENIVNRKKIKSQLKKGFLSFFFFFDSQIKRLKKGDQIWSMVEMIVLVISLGFGDARDLSL